MELTTKDPVVKLKHLYSWVAILMVVIMAVKVDRDLALWQIPDRVIEWDVHSYYAYLPALFIYDDIHLVKSDYLSKEGVYLFWPTETESGARVIKTTMGLSILYSPFFFIGHTYAYLFDYPQNGWSAPYKVFLLFGGLCYLVLGLVVLRSILTRLGFNDLVIAITLLLVGLGTNLFCYATQSATMSHVYSFTLIALFIHLTMTWHERPNYRTALLLGALVGLISLVRPTNALVALFFVLYGVRNVQDIREKLNSYLGNYGKILLIIVAAIVVWVPQFVYWKIVAGELFFNPYVGERFFWNRPHIIEGLFGFRKGWFIYTPVMFFAVLGLFSRASELKKFKTGIILFVLANVYVTFAWWCWWYGGTYGQRSMIDSYALMAIPLCVLIDRWRYWWVPLRWSGVVLGAFFIWLNYFQTYQFERHSLHYDSMTAELYFKQFGRMEPIVDCEKYLDHPDYERARTTGR